jgi:hypothetical protein
MPKKKVAKEWRKPLPNVVKAEMLAGTFHLFTDHMPELFKTLPEWLQKQIRQTEYDCATDFRDFTPEDLEVCKEYSQWLNARFPQKAPKKK